MRPRHTAALVLVGWYLMVPPWKSGHGPDSDAPLSDAGAPLSKWTVVSSHDSARDCETKRMDLLDSFRKTAEAYPSDRTFRALYDHAALDICVATDDPRLVK